MCAILCGCAAGEVIASLNVLASRAYLIGNPSCRLEAHFVSAVVEFNA